MNNIQYDWKIKSYIFLPAFFVRFCGHMHTANRRKPDCFRGIWGPQRHQSISLLDETAPQEYNNFAIKAAEWPQAARHEESPGTAGQDAS